MYIQSDPSDQSRIIDFIALSLLPPRCWRRAAEQIRDGDRPAAVLARLATARGEDLSAAVLRSHAAAALARGNHGGVWPLVWGGPGYPPQLAALADPPIVLWLRGDAEALGSRAVAIVGARAASPYALAVGEQLARDLAARGVIVVSGMARGVDAAAHRGALAAHGRTVAVLGCGADVIYPREHDRLAAGIRASGGVVSELVPGTAPHKRWFPLRNRIISGLSRAVVVIEAGEKSGSLITARCALEQGRDVLAVPGNVLSGRNRGAHALLRDGAKIVESADDILEELKMPGALQPSRLVVDDPVLAAMPAGDACDLDEIAARSRLESARLLPRLLELELLGLVRRAAGGRFVRVDKAC
jgi:DNA processing protein